MRHVRFSSFILSSWQLGPIDGIGRDCGRESFIPFWTCRNKYPASIRALDENGGVAISPFSQTIGLSCGLISYKYVRYDILSSLIDEDYEKFPFSIIESNLQRLVDLEIEDYIIPGDPTRLNTL